MPGDDPRIGRTRVRPIAGKGLGLVAVEPIAAGEIIEQNHCIALNAADTRAIDSTRLGRYVFAWGLSPEGPLTAVALGNLSFCNHSRRPNATLDYDDTQPVIGLRARAPIAAGAEITIDYGHDLDFEALE